jgi:isopentenyl-diphosphate delta-isomerase
MKSRNYQLYNKQGQPKHGQHSTKDDVLHNGLLHGAAHMWLWRCRNGQVEVLLQRRAPGMLTFPGKWDISAAGHIDGGEEPLTTAVREIQEELGLHIAQRDLLFVFQHRLQLTLDNGLIENEYRWVYLVEITGSPMLGLEKDEVSAAKWVPLAQLKADIANDERYAAYVPQGRPYFAMLFEALERVAAA